MAFFSKKRKRLLGVDYSSRNEAYDPRQELEERDAYSSYDDEAQGGKIYPQNQREAYSKEQYPYNSQRDAYGREQYPHESQRDAYGREQYPHESQRDAYGREQYPYDRQRDNYGYPLDKGAESYYRDEKRNGHVADYRRNEPRNSSDDYRRKEQAKRSGQSNYDLTEQSSGYENDFERQEQSSGYYQDDRQGTRSHWDRSVPTDREVTQAAPQKRQNSKYASRKYEENGVVYYPQSSDIRDKGKSQPGEKTEKKSFFPIFKDNAPGYVPPTYYKRPIDSKLTIILVENTAKVSENKEVLLKIIKGILSTGFACVINYGSTVEQSEIYDFSSFDKIKILCKDDQEEKACFYDALVSLKTLFDKKFLATEKRGIDEFTLSKVEIIGIGTGQDNCSTVSKEEGIKSFCDVIRSSSVTSKFFCLTEENFIDVAEIGFRSIGAICRNY